MEKQTFQIPDGCKAITMEQIGNQIVTTFEVEPKFKDGDVLISTNTNVLCVFKRYTNLYKFESYTNNIKCTDLDWLAGSFRLATPEEAQRLWNALAKEGKRWNPETMEVEGIKKDRWRAKRGENYYFLDSRFIIIQACENSHTIDNIRYNSGNYFRTTGQAERAKPYIQKALDDFWKEELK